MINEKSAKSKIAKSLISVGIILLIGVLSFFILTNLSFVFASDGNLNLSAPANYSNISGSYVFNVSYLNETDITIWSVANSSVLSNFTYNSSASGSAVWTLITYTGFNCNAYDCWATVDTTGMTDGRYTIRATLNNGTGNNVTVGTVAKNDGNWSHNVIIDNTPPNVTTFYNVTANGNYSGNITINVTVTDDVIGIESVWLNITNSTGQQVNWTRTSNCTNISHKQYNAMLFNVTVDTDLFASADGLYNITVWTNDTQLGNLNNTEEIQIRIDRDTPPQITSFTNNGNYSGNLTINVSISDNVVNGEPVGWSVEYVFFNITNSTNDQVNWTQASNTTGGWWNSTLDTDILNGDGLYNITIWANDTTNNLNKTEIIHILVDDTNPVVTLTESNSTTTSLTITVSATELSNLAGVCSVDRSGVNVYRSGTKSQTMTESSLTCGTSYAYTVTCIDEVGNSGSSAATSFSTDACPSGGTYSGTSGTTPTGKTYKPTEEQLKEGYEKALKQNEVVQVKVAEVIHSVKVTKIESNKVTIVISSDPVTLTLLVGDTRKVDIDKDGVYDLSVELNVIEGGKAYLALEYIDEVVTSKSKIGEEEKEKQARELSEGERGLWWVWLLIAVVVIVVAVVLVKKKKQTAIRKK